MKYIGNKRASIKMRELGQGLKKAFLPKKIDGEQYEYAGNSFSRITAAERANEVIARGGKVKITTEGKMYFIWAHYKGKPIVSRMNRDIIQPLRGQPRISPRTPRLK